MGSQNSIGKDLTGKLKNIPCPPAGKPIDLSSTPLKKPNSIMESILPNSGKAVKTAELARGKIIKPIPVLKKQSFWTKLKNTKLFKSTGNAIKKVGNSLKSGFSKIGKFFKGKGGKIGLAIAAGAALIAGGKYLYDKYNEPKTTTPQENTTPNYAEEEFSPDEQALIAQQDNTRVAQQPILKPIPVVETETDKVTEPEETTPPVPTEYEVKKGDNVWNIAKQHLKDLSDDPNYQPTNAEILKHTKDLIALNELHFEPDNYTVIINPKDTIKFVA